MEIKTKAIVMGSTSKGEADKRVRLFSLDNGIIEATARGVKKQGAKLTACTFMFAFVEVVLHEKNGFFTVTSADFIEPFDEIGTDIEKFEIASASLEIIAEFLKNQEDFSLVFVELLNLFKILSFAENTDIKLAFSKWLVDMIQGFGYKLDLSKCNVCEKQAHESNSLFVDLQSGLCFCDDHKPQNRILSSISPQLFKIIQGLQKVSLSNMHGRQIKDNLISSAEVQDFLISLIEGIMGKKIKSILKI